MRFWRGTIPLLLTALALAGCGSTESAAQSPTSSTAKPPAPVSTAPVRDPEAKTPPASFNADLAYAQAGALAAGGRLADARQAFRDAARLAPMNGALEAAVAIFDDLAANRVPEVAVQRLFQAGQYATNDRWAEAHAAIDDAIKLAPRYPRAHGLRGTLLLEQGKLDDALEAFDTVVRLDPEFAEGHYNRGGAHAALDHFDAAIADFTRAIEIRPDYWIAYTNRAFTLVRRGMERDSAADGEAALADYNEAHKLNPQAVEPIYLRGVLFAIGELWPQAEADFTAAIAIDASHQGAYYNRGLAYQNQGRDDRAIADYTKAIELDPTDPKPLINRGLLYARQSRHDLAAADKARAAALQK